MLFELDCQMLDMKTQMQHLSNVIEFSSKRSECEPVLGAAAMIHQRSEAQTLTDRAVNMKHSVQQ